MLIYHIFIALIHIILQIIICINNLNFGLKKKKSSIKLTTVIKNQKNQIKYNFKLCGIKKKLTRKKTNTKTTPILCGIGGLLCQYFSGLSNILNFIKSLFVANIKNKDNNTENINNNI